MLDNLPTDLKAAIRAAFLDAATADKAAFDRLSDGKNRPWRNDRQRRLRRHDQDGRSSSTGCAKADRLTFAGAAMTRSIARPARPADGAALAAAYDRWWRHGGATWRCSGCCCWSPSRSPLSGPRSIQHVLGSGSAISRAISTACRRSTPVRASGPIRSYWFWGLRRWLPAGRDGTDRLCRHDRPAPRWPGRRLAGQPQPVQFAPAALRGRARAGVAAARCRTSCSRWSSCSPSASARCPACWRSTLHTTGTLGKLFTEVVESIDMHPVDGVAAAGGGWLSRCASARCRRCCPTSPATRCCVSK